jgi:hypothetical protein
VNDGEDVTSVLEFLGALAAAAGADELGRLAGQSGRGLAVALARVVALHRPDNVSGCLECRSMRRPCLTWDAISGALREPADAKAQLEFRSLLRRYGPGNTTAPTS